MKQEMGLMQWLAGMLDKADPRLAALMFKDPVAEDEKVICVIEDDEIRRMLALACELQIKSAEIGLGIAGGALEKYKETGDMPSISEIDAGTSWIDDQAHFVAATYFHAINSRYPETRGKVIGVRRDWQVVEVPAHAHHHGVLFGIVRGRPTIIGSH